MSSFRLILASLLYHWRVNLAVACGVAVGTAVLTGALLVGDSMRGSLRDLTLDRLGRIDYAMVTDRFFRAALADELAASPQFQEHFSAAVPVVLVRGSIEWQPRPPEPPVRVSGVNVIACDERFWQLGSGGPSRPPRSRREVVLNQPLAERLGIGPGEAESGVLPEPATVMLYLPNVGTVPSGTLLGRKTDTVRGHDLSVTEVIPAEGLGRFGLRPSQQQPLNAYVSLELGRRLLRRQAWPADLRANAILVAGKEGGERPSPHAGQSLQRLLQPALEDYGIRVERTPRGYSSVTTDRMLFDPAAERLVSEALAGWEAQPVLTYLANTIAAGDRQIAYSTITAIDFTDRPPLGPFASTEGSRLGPLGDDEIVLNDWAAQDLEARPGDTIRVSYFEPESTHGQLRERTAAFKLVAVVPLEGPAGDPAFTPEVPGVTDQDSINNWDPPFQPFHRDRIRPPRKDPKYPPDQQDQDERYWEQYKATPKAFVSLATGRRLWGSRFGRTTSFRVMQPQAGTAATAAFRADEGHPTGTGLSWFLRWRLGPQAASLGFVFQPVKQQGLDASVGATSFSGLFIAFSFFIIAAAVMLVALLFRLGIDARADQVGLLLAVGLSRRKVASLLSAEGFAIAGLGSFVGIGIGIGYARLMLLGLSSKHWWLGAIGTPFLRFHATAESVLIGYCVGVVVALGAIAWAVWRTRRTPARQLLAGQIGDPSAWLAGRAGAARWIARAMLLGAIALGVSSSVVGGEAQAGAFFGAGAMVLAASLAWTWARLRAGAVGAAVAAGRGNLARLSSRNLARHPARSTLSIGLVAAAAFLIVSISAFRADPRGQRPERASGNGGFALVAESDQPILFDLGTEQGRRDLGFLPDDSRTLEGTRIWALRATPGDDATCLNLYQPRQPRILGLPRKLIQRGGFAFTRWEKTAGAEQENPWLLLERHLGRDGDGVPLVPVVADAATATYALHRSKNIPTLDVADGQGQPMRLKIMGVLPGSIFQGDLLMSEESLLEHFPQTSGYQFFLIEATPEQTRAVREALERSLASFGLWAETTGERLARFLVVQNTYLGTFQSLGGLGLLLGTFGLAAVQLRSVLERRGELALLRATGFRRLWLAWLVMLENGLLLIVGLACGVAAAAVAVLPHLVSGGASIPWGSLAATLFLVLAVGLAAGLGAVRAVLRAPLLAALRGE